jgi:hypothetical protein
MSEKEYHNKKWAVADFERYHAGKMPDAERHALEKAALDDPFLEDALEGYAFTNTPVQDINELTEKLAGKRKRKTAVWFQFNGGLQVLKIAAILVVFIGLAWLLRIKVADKEGKIAIIKKEDLPATVFSKADSSLVIQADTGSAIGEPIGSTYSKPAPKIPGAAKETILQPSIPQASSPTDDVIAAAPREFLQDTQSSKDFTAVEKVELFSKEKASAAPAAINRAIESKVSGVTIRNQNQIRGRVVDNAGNPVAFANINDRQNNMILSADKDGYFSLNNRQNAPNVKVDVNAVGFETNNIALNANAGENKIILQESKQALSEVVVTGYAKTKRSQHKVSTTSVEPVKNNFEKGSDKIILTNIVPVGGWNNFNRFMKDSLYPDTAYFGKFLKNRSVHLKFDLDKDGAATNITTLQSESDSLGETGSKVLKALPPLKKIKKSKQAEVIIRF